MQQNTRTLPLHRLLAALATALACGPLLAAPAGNPAHAEAKARYDTEMAACRNGQTTQSQTACMDEARSAYAEARRGVLGDGLEVDTGALMKRCEALEGDERTACMARMNGQGTTSGSVGAGGIYRELTTREPGPTTATPRGATKAMPAPAAKEGNMVPRSSSKTSNEGAVKPTPQ